MNYLSTHLHLFLTSALLLIHANVLHAQTAPELLETLVVSGERSSDALLKRHLVKKTAEDFAVGARLDPAELLRTIPGVQVDSRSNYAQDTRISLRGFGARSAFGVRGIDLQVDGIPLSTPDGQGQLASVMLDNIASVQVLRGPMAALYGNGAGGVIALQTAAPDTSNVGVSFVGGDPGLARHLLSGEWRNNNIAMRAQVAKTNIDGERPHSRAEREQIALQLFYTTDNDLDLIIKYDASDDPLLQDPLGLTVEQWRSNPTQINPLAEIYNTRKSVTHQQNSISLRDNTGATRWQTGLWQGERAITQYLGFAGDAITGSGGVVDLQRDFSGANVTLTHSLQLFNVPTDISVGAEFAQMQDDRRGYVNERGIAGELRRDEAGEVNSRDIYSLIQLHPSEKFMLYSGARHSQLDFAVTDYFIVPPATGANNNLASNPDDSGARQYSEDSFAIGAHYAFTAEWELFASSGRGYETPTLTEMAYKSDATGLNIDLQTALNRQQEWGITYQSDEFLELNLTQFIIATENEIVVDQSVGGRTSYRNAAETERKGYELFGRYALNANLLMQFSLQSLSAVYSAGEWNGRQLPGVAREQYQLSVQWLPFATDVLQLDLGAQQRSRIYSADNNQVYAPDFYTLDLSARGAYSANSLQVNWWLKLANLSDETYVGSVIVNQSNGRAFEPALGRNLSAGISLVHNFR
ncbi:TonB-dependent receptor family protein [Cellvibrio sp. OA-2007]|uniref:TonB-dependent receptor family protein n=1 Tax=Cellvibrio sp. OA-2007 TaxID=529823 RepID=UPI0007825511|nr:TonB-dependent receptor [Cellvibrio sp. OA-2007]